MLFAWIASLVYGLIAVTGKLTGKHVAHNPRLFHFFWQLFTVIGILPLALALLVVKNLKKKHLDELGETLGVTVHARVFAHDVLDVFDD